MWERGEALQCDPHGGTEELLVSEHCLADCPRRLPVFFRFTLHCRRPSAEGRSRGRSAEPGPPPHYHHHHPPPPPETHTHGANGHSHSPEDCSSLPPTPTWCLCYFLQATTPFWLGRRRLYCAGRRRFDSNVMQGERFNPVQTLFGFLRELCTRRGEKKKTGCPWSL